MTDDVMVQPVRTYLEGSELVTPETEPYPASRSHAIELRNGGLATFEEPAAEIEPAPPVEPPPTPEAEPAAPNPAGRRRRAP